MMIVQVSMSMWLLYMCMYMCWCRYRCIAGVSELDGVGFEAFGRRPKTGVVYEGAVPRHLTGIQVSAMRLKSGSLMMRGVKRYGEFEIPKGVVTHPYVERLALLYHNLGNWSLAYYPPPSPNYTYLAPVLGLLAYEYEFEEDDDDDALEANIRNNNSSFSSSSSSSSSHDHRLLSIHASALPIYIHFSQLLLPMPSTSTVVPRCVFFDINGSFNISDMLPDNICTTFQQGHISVVIAASSSPPTHSPSPSKKEKEKERVWKIVGCVFGGGFALLGIGAVGASKYKQKQRKKMQSMEMAAEFSEALYMTAVGTTKAPAAIGTRTHPKLETEYVP